MHVILVVIRLRVIARLKELIVVIREVLLLVISFTLLSVNLLKVLSSKLVITIILIYSTQVEVVILVD
jgi:hypothetical protein